MTLRRLFPRTLPLAPLLLATVVHAHPGHPHPFEEVDEFESPAADFAQAMLHPFTGLDHLVAALAVGCLAFLMGRRLGGLAVALFMGCLAMGWNLGRLGLALPMLEPGLALSVVAAGSLLALHARTGMVLRLGIIATLGFWHGSAHGMEMASAAQAAGLLAGTGAALMGGALLALVSAKLSPVAIKYAGAAAAVAGLIMVAQRLG